MKDIELMGDSSIRKIFTKIITSFNWPINQGYLSQNFFKGKLDLTRKKEVIEEHFTSSGLELMSGDDLKKDSLDKDRLDRYWVSLISLLTLEVV